VRRGPARIAQVGGGLVRASLAIAMQYRTDFVIDGVTGVLRTLAAVAPIALVFSQRESVLGWTAPEITLVAGLYFFMQAVLAGLVEPNLGEIVEAVRSGSLDFVLLKPADAQVLVSLRRVDPSHLWDLLAAVLLCGWSLSAMETPSVVDVAAALVMLTSGLAAMYGIWLLAICTSFFFVRVDNLRYLLWSITDAGRWPLGVFARWVQVVLVVVIPVAVITTFPALALRGAWSWPLIATGAGVGVLFLVISRWAWNASLASYTSASS
jgi:ABC-2 type transport system permease protein